MKKIRGQEKKEVSNKILELEELLKLKKGERIKQLKNIELEKIENDRKEKIVKSLNLVLRYFNKIIKNSEKNVPILKSDYNNIMEKIENIENLTNNKKIRKMTSTKQKSKELYNLK